MAQFEAFDDGVEVNGQTVLSFIEGTPMERTTRELLAENGIEDPQSDEWYPQEAWLAAFQAMADEVGTTTVKRIGKTIPENAEWPDGIDSVAGGVESINEAYQMNHRGGDIGYYDVERQADNELRVTCMNPYPCSFDQGILKATAEEFADGGFVSVDECGEDCRADGGETCVYEVSW